jgi:hypothetical protein
MRQPELASGGSRAWLQLVAARGAPLLGDRVAFWSHPEHHEGLSSPSIDGGKKGGGGRSRAGGLGPRCRCTRGWRRVVTRSAAEPKRCAKALAVVATPRRHPVPAVCVGLAAVASPGGTRTPGVSDGPPTLSLPPPPPFLSPFPSVLPCGAGGCGGVWCVCVWCGVGGCGCGCGFVVFGVWCSRWVGCVAVSAAGVLGVLLYFVVVFVAGCVAGFVFVRLRLSRFVGWSSVGGRFLLCVCRGASLGRLGSGLVP